MNVDGLGEVLLLLVRHYFEQEECLVLSLKSLC